MYESLIVDSEAECRTGVIALVENMNRSVECCGR